MEDAEKRKMQKIRKKHRQKKFLTSKEIKQLKLHELPIACHRYDLFLPLHQLWLQYMDDLCDKSSAEAFTQKLLKADLHGCRLTVCRTKCPSLLGISGIVVQETENCFKIITKEDSMKMVPKSNNVFTLPSHQSVFTIYGNQFKYRGSERAVRKFKAKSTIDM
ncbi:ribonuclease P protein subunit p29 [Paraphysoderma sedebokerense]|nr:ribonuclease P protein subunit p29 [Paraphysoderma sedebokerense]